MIVVSDTSPLNYLVLIGAEGVLPKLFQDVYAPPQVLRELSHLRAPETVRRWANAPPEWLRIASPGTIVEAPPGLGPGEAHAIALAKELRAEWLLMDERDGTRFAKLEGLHVVGTLAVLEQAAVGNLLELGAALDRLQKTSFRISPQLVQAALDRDARRKRSQGQE